MAAEFESHRALVRKEKNYVFFELGNKMQWGVWGVALQAPQWVQWVNRGGAKPLENLQYLP